MKQLVFNLIVLTLLVSSCQEKNSSFPIPDVSEININNSIVRYEKLLLNIDTTTVADDYINLHESHLDFTELYFDRIVPLKNETENEFLSSLEGILTTPSFRSLADTVMEVYPDFENTIGNDFRIAFKNFKHYLPQFRVPDIYTFVSEYGYQQFLFPMGIDSDGLGIGLDLFLGEKFPYHKIAPGNPAFSTYLTRTFNRDHIVKKSIELLIEDYFPAGQFSTLLEYMIDNGKKLYFLHRILPTTADSIILEYSSSQIEWVKNNELQMWGFFFDEKLFYETDLLKISKYINPSPNSAGMPSEAPGRVGNYIGYQIIKAYMERFPETTLPELMEIENAQKIMDASKYRPKRKG